MEITPLGHIPFYLESSCWAKLSKVVLTAPVLYFSHHMCFLLASFLPPFPVFSLGAEGNSPREVFQAHTSCNHSTLNRLYLSLGFSFEHQLFHKVTRAIAKRAFIVEVDAPFGVNTRSCRKPLCVSFLQPQPVSCDSGRQHAVTVQWLRQCRPHSVGRGVIQLCEHIRQLRASHTGL